MGQMEFYKNKGINLEEYVKTVGLRNLIKEKLLDIAIEVFINDNQERSLAKNRYNKEYFILDPMEFYNILPFS